MPYNVREAIKEKAKSYGDTPVDISPDAFKALQLAERFGTGAGNRALEYGENAINRFSNIGSLITGDDNPEVKFSRLNSAVPDSKGARIAEKSGSIGFDVANTLASSRAIDKGGVLSPIQKAIADKLGQTKLGFKAEVLGKIDDVVGLRAKDGRILAYNTKTKKLTKIPEITEDVARDIKLYVQGKEQAPLKVVDKITRPAWE